MQHANHPEHRPVPRVDSLRTDWLATVTDRLGPPPSHVLAAADRLVTSVLHEPARTTQSLTWFASTLGSAGWDLGTVAALVDRLAGLLAAAGEPHPELSAFDAGSVAGRGWANGYLPIVTSESCTDSLTGLATLGVLSWRLRQVYDQCGALGVDPVRMYALAVLDVVCGGSLLARDIARVATAGLARQRFCAGETVVATGNRFLALASRTAELDDQVAVLAAEVRCHAALAEATVMAWVEPLPTRADEIDRYLFDVV